MAIAVLDADKYTRVNRKSQVKLDKLLALKKAAGKGQVMGGGEPRKSNRQKNQLRTLSPARRLAAGTPPASARDAGGPG